MFIQVLQAPCTRQDEVRDHAMTWRSELGEGATGWLGGTFGFTDDNMFLGVVRFDSKESAMANAARPEQTAWAEKMASLMDGPVEYHDCEDVTMFMDGGSDQAGFVQIIRGKMADPTPLRDMLADTSDLHAMRPEIIGGTLAIEADGTYTETIAFTDEESARKGEQIEPPADVRDALEQAMASATFYDLHHPWFESA